MERTFTLSVWKLRDESVCHLETRLAGRSWGEAEFHFSLENMADLLQRLSAQVQPFNDF
jgi:hypothetical protein